MQWWDLVFDNIIPIPPTEPTRHKGPTCMTHDSTPQPCWSLGLRWQMTCTIVGMCPLSLTHLALNVHAICMQLPTCLFILYTCPHVPKEFSRSHHYEERYGGFLLFSMGFHNEIKDWLSPRIWGISIFIIVVRFLLSLKLTQGNQPKVQGLKEYWANIYKDKNHIRWRFLLTINVFYSLIYSSLILIHIFMVHWSFLGRV